MKRRDDFPCGCVSLCQYRVKRGHGMLCQTCVAAGCVYGFRYSAEKSLKAVARCEGSSGRMADIKRKQMLRDRRARRYKIVAADRRSLNQRADDRAKRIEEFKLKAALARVKAELANWPAVES